MRALKFFPLSDVMSASVLKNFQLNGLHFKHPRDLTWWEEPVHYFKTPLGTHAVVGIANLVIQVTLGLPIALSYNFFRFEPKSNLSQFAIEV